MRHRGRGGGRRSRVRHRSRSRGCRGLHDLLARVLFDLVDRKRRRGRHLGGQAWSTRSMEERRLLLGHRLHRRGFLLRLGALLAPVGLAGLGGRGRLGGGPRALLLLGGDPGRERFLLQLALGLVFFAAVDPLLPRREGVDLEGPLQLVRAVLVDRAGGGLDVHPQFLEAVDHLLAREVQVPRELEDPNVPHPASLPGPSPPPCSRRPAPARLPPPPIPRTRASPSPPSLRPSPRRPRPARPPAAPPPGARPPRRRGGPTPAWRPWPLRGSSPPSCPRRPRCWSAPRPSWPAGARGRPLRRR